jgi:type II pantothenate kinase
MFLRHEGFLGALGAFVSHEKHGRDDLMVHQLMQQYPITSSLARYKICSPLNGELNDNESLECSVYAS